MAIRPLEQAILVAIDRLTRDTYGNTDSDAIAQILEDEGRDLPALFDYKRVIMNLRTRAI